jgi:hypothetical protein
MAVPPPPEWIVILLWCFYTPHGLLISISTFVVLFLLIRTSLRRIDGYLQQRRNQRKS